MSVGVFMRPRDETGKMTLTKMTLRIGTRSSALALWQANHVRKELEKVSVSAEIVHIKTEGDLNHSDPIVKMSAQGVFVKEIQKALLEDRIDLAVHSLKDLPIEPVVGLHFAATLSREDVSDVFVSRKYKTPDELPSGARVGTGSLRRRCQLAHRFCEKNLLFDDIRGNIETRLRKLDCGEYDALVLAAAGLRRLGFDERITDAGRFSPLEFLPAPGQGALGLECREDDRLTLGFLTRINDARVYAAVTAERAFLARLRGGCIAPIGAFARYEKDTLLFNGRILSPDGKKRFDVYLTDEDIADPQARLSAAHRLGVAAADKITTPEVKEILDSILRVREA